MPGPFSGLKSYQGFERDMFVAVRDYFRCLPQPLIPTEYYDLFVNVLGKFLLLCSPNLFGYLGNKVAKILCSAVVLHGASLALQPT